MTKATISPPRGKVHEEKGDKRLRIVMPVPLALRIFFVAIALFCIVVPTWELRRGVWPLNWTSPFFLFIMGGAWTIGIPAALAGITGWAESWTIRPGRIHIVRRNPLGLRRYSFGPGDLRPFEIVEREAMEGHSTWFIALVTSSGKRFQTHDLQTRSAAEQMRDRILREFDD